MPSRTPAGQKQTADSTAWHPAVKNRPPFSPFLAQRSKTGRRFHHFWPSGQKQTADSTAWHPAVKNVAPIASPGTQRSKNVPPIARGATRGSKTCRRLHRLAPSGQKLPADSTYWLPAGKNGGTDSGRAPPLKRLAPPPERVARMRLQNGRLA